MKEKKEKKGLFYRIVYRTAKTFRKKQEVVYAECVPDDEAVVFVANHAQAFGPISMIVGFDKKVRPWIGGDIMKKETAPEFIFVQFFAGNIKKHKRWNMLKSKFVAKILVNIFKNVDGIPVYYDRRVMNTFTESVQALENGENIVIFGETPIRFSPYVAEIHDGFVQMASIYYKKTGKILKFFPVYIAPGYISVGEHTSFNPDAELKPERVRISKYLRDNILKQALALPKHTPIATYTEEYFQAIEKQQEDRKNA